MTCDFQQCGILTSVDADEPMQSLFKRLCAELTAASWMLEPFREVGAIYSLHLSSQT